MKVIIVGMGQKGALLANLISRDRHDVLVVDRNKDRIEDITNHFNVSGLVGSGASKGVLDRAGAKTADVMIAVTPEDEVNLLICQMAKKSGTRYAMAALNQPDIYEGRRYIKEELGIDYIVNPKRDTATEIMRDIGMPGAVDAEAFFDAAAFISLKIHEKSPLADMAMPDIRSFFETDMLVGTVTRGEQVFIPKGDFVLAAGDTIGIFAPNTSMNQIMMKLGLIRKPVRRVFIIGGGTIAFYLAKQLLAEGKAVTILESDKRRCTELLEQLPDAEIACGFSENADILKEEGIEQADVCVTLTGRDDTNMVVSMFAWSLGMQSIITKVESAAYMRLMDKVNMNITVSPSSIAADRFLRYVRNVAVYNAKGHDIKRMYRVANGLAEAFEFIAYDNFAKKGIPFKSPDFKLKKNVLIAAIIREGSVIIPNGDSVIKEKDHVVVIATRNTAFHTINDIFS